MDDKGSEKENILQDTVSIPACTIACASRLIRSVSFSDSGMLLVRISVNTVARDSSVGLKVPWVMSCLRPRT